MPTRPAALPADLAALAERLPAPLLALAARDGRRLALERGARLFVAGEAVRGLHVVVSGGVRVVRESVERAVVVHHEGPGGLLGEVALFTDGVYPGSAVATEPTALRLVPADAVRRALAAEPAIAELLLRRLARRAREVIERLDRVAHLTVVRRVALHLLARAAAAPAHGRAAGPPVVSLGMTQAALAEELGTVKPIVVRELGTLRRLGLVEAVGAGRYRVRDVAGLRALAGVAPGAARRT
jgi:CRP-like cAMP-binding protein